VLSRAAGWLSPVIRWLSPVARWLSPVIRWLSPVIRWLSPVAGWLSPVTRWLSPSPVGVSNRYAGLRMEFCCAKLRRYAWLIVGYNPLEFAQSANSILKPLRGLRPPRQVADG
jgi:hypothetical protein